MHTHLRHALQPNVANPAWVVRTAGRRSRVTNVKSQGFLLHIGLRVDAWKQTLPSSIWNKMYEDKTEIWMNLLDCLNLKLEQLTLNRFW